MIDIRRIANEVIVFQKYAHLIILTDRKSHQVADFLLLTLTH